MERVTIETNRLLLREFAYSDATPMFYNWASDSEVTKFMTWPVHQTIEDSEKIVHKFVSEIGKTPRFAITIKETGEVIGCIDVAKMYEGYPEIGYVLSRKHWNNGYMSEACQAFVEYLVHLGYKTIYISHVHNNIASQRVIEKCGFKFKFQKMLPFSLAGGEEKVTVLKYYKLER